MKYLIIFILSSLILTGYSQNSAEMMLDSNGQKLTIGGYGQVDYNQQFSSDKIYNGKLDVHRMVLMTGYKFNNKTQFISEFEFEHVSEVFVEQAFINHKIKPWINLRVGLLLIPMGIINEYHEPTMFNGVERPNIDNVIVPTTWREIGAGFAGRFDDISLKYQIYLVNGFKSYNNEGTLSGANGLRNGRQKGAESIISSPNLSCKAEYYGIPGLKFGISGYFGNTQSTLFNGLSKDDELAIATADSSVISVRMVGLDGRYNIKNFHFKAQYNIINLGNTQSYNEFTGKDIGSSIRGFYTEIAYEHNLNEETGSALVPFLRFETYDTHNATEGGLDRNESYKRTEIVGGIGWKLSNTSILKADTQFYKSAADDKYITQLNLGLGVWF